MNRHGMSESTFIMLVVIMFVVTNGGHIKLIIQMACQIITVSMILRIYSFIKVIFHSFSMEWLGFFGIIFLYFTIKMLQYGCKTNLVTIFILFCKYSSH